MNDCVNVSTDLYAVVVSEKSTTQSLDLVDLYLASSMI